MNVNRIDLNLLVYLDALLRERNVTQAANQLSLSQPAMSNGLRRLRELFDDPLLVRTSDGMTPTERALELEPVVREVLSKIDKAVQPRSDFEPDHAQRVFRIMASDYGEATLFPAVLAKLRDLAPGITLDIMTPSDVSFLDVERGKVDMVINRFDSMPQSFHQIHLWDDTFSCILNVDHPMLENFTLDNYLAGDHVWVSKTGMGVGVGVNPDDVQRLGWVDLAINKLGKKRQIRVFYPPLPSGNDAGRTERPDRHLAHSRGAPQTRQPTSCLARSAPGHTSAGAENGLEPFAPAQPG